MPELAEVEYFRKQWNPGLGQKIRSVSLHADKRIFRGSDTSQMEKALPGSTLLESSASGKQMVFRFSKNFWLGIHLGMTGAMRVEKPDFLPAKHDHLVLFQKQRALVFADMRHFGRVRFAQTKAAPDWWAAIPPALSSEAFTLEIMESFLQRHRKLPIKPALLLQNGFPGVGNWMADEILWRAELNPHTPSGNIKGKDSKALWKQVRFVCREAIKHVSEAYADLPKGWLFNERWNNKGVCPKHNTPLKRETIGGRTTAWCSKCQK
ncbi:MAG: mutM [Verrucomicrobiales bacterium]|nr:mutM [Verrucomicrobiales bacterium]